MTCDLFEYSGEDFNTGVGALDTDLDLAQAAGIELTLADTSTVRDFIVGETVSQLVTDTVVITGEVVSWSETTNKLYVSKIQTTDTTGNYQSFVLTDTTAGRIIAEDTLDGDLIVLSGTGQEGYYIDFEDGTASLTIPSYVTDGTTGTDALLLETTTVDRLILESGTGFDQAGYLSVEDSLASRRSIGSVGSAIELSTDAGAFNLDLETDADGIIDFSEGNPFGDAT